MTRVYKPMLAKLAPQPFSSSAWIFEIKWDGFRAIAYVNETLSLRSRNGKELKHVFPELEELKHLAVNVVLDGEIVLMKDGSIVQTGTINDLIKNPADDFVTKFIKAQRSSLENKN